MSKFQSAGLLATLGHRCHVKISQSTFKMTSFSAGSINWLATLSRPLHQRTYSERSLPYLLAWQVSRLEMATVLTLFRRLSCSRDARHTSEAVLIGLFFALMLTFKRSHALVTRHDNDGAQSPVPPNQDRRRRILGQQNDGQNIQQAGFPDGHPL
jgi:hypothetical protein